MRFMLVSVCVGLALAAVLAGSVQLPAVQDRLMDRAINKAVNIDSADLFDDDGLKVFFCGTSSPIASLKRAQACTAIIAGRRIYLVDAGTGSNEVLQKAGLPHGGIAGVFLTHFHSDHIGDLSEVNLISWVNGRNTPLSVFGPQGVREVVDGINAAFALDNTYRTAHHGKAIAPPRAAGLRALAFDGLSQAVIYEADGLKVTAFPVHHAPVNPAVGYRFDYQGRSVVISGDTAYASGLIEAAQGADLLVHEAQANHMVIRMQDAAAKAGRVATARILADIQNYHTSPTEAAEAANKAGAEWLVLTHLTPPPDNPVMRRIFMRGVSAIRPGKVKLADDRMMVLLPRDGGVTFTQR